MTYPDNAHDRTARQRQAEYRERNSELKSQLERLRLLRTKRIKGYQPWTGSRDRLDYWIRMIDELIKEEEALAPQK